MAYSKGLKLLVVNRLIKSSSEFYVHHHWFDQTAMDFLLDSDFQVAEKNRLYRCLGRILPYKDELCQHLKEQWETMFKLQYDVLLYDLTSTYSVYHGHMCEQSVVVRVAQNHYIFQ